MVGRLWLALVFLGAIFMPAAPGAPARPAPQSGFIHTAQYGVDKQGKLRGTKRYERVWFQGKQTRTDLFIGDTLTFIQVHGPRCWIGYPAAGWSQACGKHAEDAPYPAEVRRKFDLIFSSRPVRKTTTVNGISCWLYTWHQPAVQAGCIGSCADDVSYWVRADSRFPEVLRFEAGAGGRRDTLAFHLNRPAPEGVFEQPKGWKPILPFRAPEGPYLISWTIERSSNQYGWTSVEHDSHRSDGTDATRTYTSTTKYPDKVASTFSPPDERRRAAEVGPELYRAMQHPTWFVVRKIGEERVLGLPCDILERIPEGVGPDSSLPSERHWVTNHPLMGTVTLRRETHSREERNTFSVTRIEAAPQ